MHAKRGLSSIGYVTHRNWPCNCHSPHTAPNPLTPSFPHSLCGHPLCKTYMCKTEETERERSGRGSPLGNTRDVNGTSCQCLVNEPTHPYMSAQVRAQVRLRSGWRWGESRGLCRYTGAVRTDGGRAAPWDWKESGETRWRERRQRHAGGLIQ